MDSIQTLQLNDLLVEDEAVHFSRSRLTKTRPKSMHTHDFSEVFWIQNGTAKHHINGSEQILPEGSMVFVRPTDVHALQGKSDEAHLVNVIISPVVLRALKHRHIELRHKFFFDDANLPKVYHRDIRQMAELSRLALRLENGPRHALGAEAFLLPLLADLLPEQLGLSDEAPAWLLQACEAAHEPRVFREGAAGMARAAGRAHAHVSRTARKFLGQSPSEFINTIRMDYAARRLSGTADSLSEIALDCGIPNLSHFHRLFREHHGQTPRAYRQRHQRDLIRPE